MGCSLYKAAGFCFECHLEPDLYLEAMTVAETLSHTSLFRSPDRVCHPYSYYFPEFAKEVPTAEPEVDAETIESVCGDCGNSCSAGLPANCDDLAKLLENGSDLATLTAKGECAASCSDECVALINDAFGSCDSSSTKSSKS